MQPKLRPFSRIKPKYNPQPNAAETRLEAMLREQPCYGCGGQAHLCHHTLLTFPEKPRRRDHRYQLGLCAPCHDQLHCKFGDEAVWLEYMGRSEGEAIEYMLGNWSEIDV